MYVLMYAAGFISAVFLSAFTAGLRRKRRLKRRAAEREKQSGKAGKKKTGKKVKIDTYVKAATSVVLAHGLIMVTMSYVLAWFEKDTVVDVSTTLITEIVAPLCLYIGTNCIMNIFEKNELSFSKPIQAQKILNILDAAHGGQGTEAEETMDAPDGGAAG